MKVFKPLLAAAILLLSVSVAHAERVPTITAYKGVDAGRVALSFALPYGVNANVRIRRLDSPGKAVIDAGAVWIFLPRDFYGKSTDTLTGPLANAGYSYRWRNDFSGNVLIKALPPGHYEIAKVEANGSVSVIKYTQSYDDLAIPFDIEAGKTTYLGEFGLWDLYTKGAIGPQFTDWLLTIRDQGERDLPIAKTHVGDLGEVVSSIPDVGRLNRLKIQTAP